MKAPLRALFGACTFLLAGLAIAGPAEEAGTESVTTPEALSPPAEVVSLPVTPPQGREGLFGLSGSMAYHMFGMNDVNNSFLNGRNGSFHGGLGYGAALKYGISREFTARLGVDYLLASADSSITISGVRYNSKVDLPATMVFIGGEYLLLPTPSLDLKLSAGYILVSIFNGSEKGTAGNNLDMGTISGSTHGAQVGAGVELSLSRSLSFEGGLAYNFARIERANFSGSPSDPGAGQANGIVDYSGLMARLAFTVYLVP